LHLCVNRVFSASVCVAGKWQRWWWSVREGGGDRVARAYYIYKYIIHTCNYRYYHMLGKKMKPQKRLTPVCLKRRDFTDHGGCFEKRTGIPGPPFSFIYNMNETKSATVLPTPTDR
jgi:hypothetical protein